MNIQDVNDDGIAMDGMDPVAHFNGEPMRGDVRYAFSIGDMTYHFANAENMQAFQDEPGKYIPIAGGYPTGTNVAPPDVEQDGKGYIGSKTYAYRKDLEDAKVSLENNVPIDMKQDGSLEMQNLHDNEA